MRFSTISVSFSCVFFFLFASCSKDQSVQAWFSQKAILCHYKWLDRDSLKYQAAQYILENIKYHHSAGQLYRNEGTKAEQWRIETDSIYCMTTQSEHLDLVHSYAEQHRLKWKSDTLWNVLMSEDLFLDADVVDYSFLKEHIDHAFKMWRSSVHSKKLSFEEFKEYILPYKSVFGYGFNETGKKYYELFGKYVLSDTSSTLQKKISCYNEAISGLRDINGKTSKEVLSGIYGLYSRDFHDCVDIANYGCNILRSCGIPVAVDYNIAYRTWNGRHYHCSVFDVDKKEWYPFNAESSLPSIGGWNSDEMLNVYRVTYAAQKDTPYFLTSPGDYIPREFSHPCIKDVTSLYKSVVSLSIKPSHDISNKVVYLATFNSRNNGLIPVTWGIMKDGSAIFSHVIPDVVYFPIYYDLSKEGQQPTITAFENPFFVTKENGIINTVFYKDVGNEVFDTIEITRKYPRKQGMIELASQMVGGRFLGSNTPDFKDARVLYEIKEPPMPAFLDYEFCNVGKFKYYRYQATSQYPNAHISMLEWLTLKSYQYPNVMPPTPVHVLESQSVGALSNDQHWVKLLDAPSWNQMVWKAEYDGDMKTSPSAYPSITLSLKEPQVVKKVRFAPRNADNGITKGNLYALYYWDNRWRLHEKKVATYQYISFAFVPVGKIYWLRNLTQGVEEQPFIMKNGRQIFLYDDFIQEMKSLIVS